MTVPKTSSAPDGVSKERINVLGVGISVLNLAIAREALLEAVRGNQKGYVCITGVHGVMESQSDHDLKRIHNRALLVTPDGMPMVWLGRRAGYRQMGRVYGPDLMLDVCRNSPEHGVKHFFFGGANGVAKDLKQKLDARFPGLNVVGTYEPPFRPLNQDEFETLREQVADAKPDIMWIGLSTPKQERFMSEYLPKLDTTLMIGVGAAFDFHAGRVRQAPFWIQRSGFEWLFRLCCEPKRLWRRYLSNNPRFVWATFKQISGIEKFEMDR